PRGYHEAPAPRAAAGGLAASTGKPSARGRIRACCAKPDSGETVAGIQYPTPLHRRVLPAILADARAGRDGRGRLLAGAPARGSARAASGIDVLVVTSGETADAAWRSAARPLPVDIPARTAGEWRARFAPDRAGDESRGYAFPDGVILHDPEGIAGSLVS